MSPILRRQAALFFRDLAQGHIKSIEILIASLDVIKELAESEQQLIEAMEVCNGSE